MLASDAPWIERDRAINSQVLCLWPGWRQAKHESAILLWPRLLPSKKRWRDWTTMHYWHQSVAWMATSTLLTATNTLLTPTSLYYVCATQTPWWIINPCFLITPTYSSKILTQNPFKNQVFIDSKKKLYRCLHQELIWSRPHTSHCTPNRWANMNLPTS